MKARVMTRKTFFMDIASRTDSSLEQYLKGANIILGAHYNEVKDDGVRIILVDWSSQSL